MVVCPKCGSSNPDYVPFCGMCGEEIPEDLREEAAKSGTKPVPPKKDLKELWYKDPLVKCESCGKLTEANIACKSCGKDPMAAPAEGPARPQSPTPEIGGACAIVAGILAIVQGLMFFRGEAVYFDITGDISGVFILIGVFEVVFGFASILAGIRARKRISYRFSLIGAVLGMVAFGFFIGGFLGLVAVILIALSHDEFKS